MFVDCLIGSQDFIQKFLHTSLVLVQALMPACQALWWKKEQRLGYKRFHKKIKVLGETVKIYFLWS